MELTTLLLLLLAAFCAAFVDAIVGGGGMISMPALLATGVSPAYALGTNKVASTMGAITSLLAYWRAGKVNKRLVLLLLPLSLIGSALGAYTVRFIPPATLKNIIVVLLIAITVYTIFRRDWGDVSRVKELSYLVLVGLAVFALVIGFYDGFFGPGTGSFLTFGFLFVGFDFITAAGNTKVLNFASNFAALLMFSSQGTVYYAYGIPMGLMMILGAYCGAKVAMAKGASYVKPLFILITACLIVKIILGK